MATSKSSENTVYLVKQNYDMSNVNHFLFRRLRSLNGKSKLFQIDPVTPQGKKEDLFVKC